MSKHQYALLMAGGKGSRLWPQSRNSSPKQFQPLLGNQSLFQHMLQLIQTVLPINQIFVMAPAEFAPIIQSEAPTLPARNLLIEPEMRDNGPAIVLGMQRLHQLDPQANVAVFWSDHIIQAKTQFTTTLQHAFLAAKKYPDYLITLGTKPTFPDPSLGYIQVGPTLDHWSDQPLYTVKQFIEKPNLETATTYCKSWEYLWNVGYKVMLAQSFLTELLKIQPALQPILESLKTNSSAYQQLPKQSIEYLFTAHLKKIAVLPADLGWSDVGTWNTLHKVLSQQSGQSVVTQGPVTALQCQDCLITASSKPIYAMGLQDIILVDAGDCILALKRSESDQLKELITLVQDQRPELLL